MSVRFVLSQLDQFGDIAQICCESSTGAADCSAGFPATCTRACAELLEPFWTSCGTLVKLLGDMYAADEDELDRFAKGQCHHTNLLFEHAAVGTCPPEMLEAWTDDVNNACCQQNGVWECSDGTPWSCDAECAISFGPFWETCLLGSVGDAAELQSFSALYATCNALPLEEDRILIRTVNNLINDPWCMINTTGIISIDAAHAACTVDESAFCDRTITSGLYTCETDYCPTCGQSHQCDHTCNLPCVGQAGGPSIGAAHAGEGAPVCQTDSFTACERSIAAGIFSCDTDYCLACPQAHSCDNTCSLPCGDDGDGDGGGNGGDNGGGHRRHLKTSQSANATDLAVFLNSTPVPHLPATESDNNRRQVQEYQYPHGALFDHEEVNSRACPLSFFVSRTEQVEDQCCSHGECDAGLPAECT